MDIKDIIRNNTIAPPAVTEYRKTDSLDALVKLGVLSVVAVAIVAIVGIVAYAMVKA